MGRNVGASQKAQEPPAIEFDFNRNAAWSPGSARPCFFILKSGGSQLRAWDTADA